MRVVIVEDERPAAARLEQALRDYGGDVTVVAHLQTVRDTVDWLKRHPLPDLLFFDVQLSDGLSLAIFKEVPVDCPVVFTTAYDAYVLDAFECNSIDYLLKPIRPERLAQTLQKYEQLRRHFAGGMADLLQRAQTVTRRVYRQRILAQRGTSFVALDASRICYAFSADKLTFLVDVDGQRYLSDAAVTALEEVLDPSAFFRLNRQYLARLAAIVSFRPASRGRLRVELKPSPGEPVFVSRERAARFRAWIEQ